MKVSAKGVSVRLGETQALLNVDMESLPGTITGLIGANGSGKTTLLRSIAGLQSLNAGAVYVDDSDIRSLTPDLRARSISYLAQGGEVHWSITVEALVSLGRLPHRGRFGGSSDRDVAAIMKAMDETDTMQFRIRTLDQLSGGEKVRALLARTLAVEAPVVLADEPIAALDPLHQLQVMGLLRKKADRQSTVIVVLHDLAIAARFCDHIVLLSAGQIVSQGEPEAVLTDANLADAFHIKAVRGERDGKSFVLPWSPIENTSEF